ncbi:MAG: hypothetical protein HY908_36990 [Myxococcales bacterium]|nr:hypothetical protein [Myxococcales bacterium]
MRVVRGRVVRGAVVVDEPLPDGSDVAVVVSGAAEPFELDDGGIAELCASIEQADRGAVLPLEQVLGER